MTIAEGHFQLYTHLTPPLKAGLWRFRTTQDLSATGPAGALGPDALPVDGLDTHVRVTSPRYVLPPDQVLSTYPPAGTEGAYGSRLPQVVIKRRTLPWEREVDRDHPDTPWLALVLVAEGEAELVTNAPVAECTTAGVHLGGPVDVEKGSYLKVRRSVVDGVLPTQRDVPLLAHAREVDVNDTELMMGDDDGFLAVVIANRLPLPGRGPDGEAVPVKYLACLVNLEGQLGALLPEAPPHVEIALLPTYAASVATLTAAGYDHLVMGSTTSVTASVLGAANPVRDEPAPEDGGPAADRADRPDGADRAEPAPDDAPAPRRDGPRGGALTDGAFTRAVLAGDLTATAATATGSWGGVTAATAAAAGITTDDVYGRMAADFTTVHPGIAELLDPELHFPVLLHWSFTSTGQTTFRTLMEDLDSGLLGTVGEDPEPPVGRPPLEVVETGHVGLTHRTYRGDELRCWYRGPLLPHPADTAAERLPLAHTADQLRAVVPDGREDISLATAFEIGRLLALASPAMVAALLRWRQGHFRAARREAVWGGVLGGLRDLLGVEVHAGHTLSVELGRGLAQVIADRPGGVLGDPSPLVTAGTPMPLDGRVSELLGPGLGLQADLTGDLAGVLRSVAEARVPVPVLADLPTRGVTALTRDRLRGALETSVGMLALDALGVPVGDSPVLGEGHVVGPVRSPREVPARHTPDALDDLLAGRADTGYASGDTEEGDAP
jgi:hypothetical protein